MGAPRMPVNPTTHSVGFTAKLVTVTSVSEDGKTAIVTDRQNTQHQVPMLVQRSKGVLPAPGEAWLITQDLGIWTFAAFVATSAADFTAGGGGSHITVGNEPPVNPGHGDVWLNSSLGNAVFTWSGTIWVAAPFGGGALAPQAVQRNNIALGAVTTDQIAPDAGIKASQVAFRAGDIGGSRVFTLTYAPTGMVPGDLWFNPAEGNTISVWNGNQWVPLLLGASAILPGSLTGAQLSDVAGIIASQVSFTAADIGGITTTISATQPSSPSLNDLWYDASADYQLRQWNGIQWVPYQWGTQAIAAGAITAELIAANTITTAQLAAGLVYAGIIDGTVVEAAVFLGSTFEGTDWIQNSIGSFYYTGSPGPGNLGMSISPFGGADPFSTAVLAGVQVFGNNGGYAQLNAGGITVRNVHNAGGGFLPTTTLTMGPDPSTDYIVIASAASAGGTGNIRFDGPLLILNSTKTQVTGQLETQVITLDLQPGTPSAPASGSVVYSDSGSTGRIENADGQVYALGHRLSQNTVGTTINTGGAYATISNPGTLGVGTYRIRGQISYSTSVGSPTGSPRVIFDQGTATLGHVRGEFTAGNTSPVVIDGSVSSVTFAGQTLTSGAQLMKFDFTLPVTAAGTFLVQAASTGSSYTINFVNLYVDPL